MREAGKDVDGHYKVSVPVVVFGKRFHHGSIGVPLVVDERGDHFASPEFSADPTIFSSWLFPARIFLLVERSCTVCPRHQTNPDVAGRNRYFPSSLDKSSSY